MPQAVLPFTMNFKSYVIVILVITILMQLVFATLVGRWKRERFAAWVERIPGISRVMSRSRLTTWNPFHFRSRSRTSIDVEMGNLSHSEGEQG